MQQEQAGSACVFVVVAFEYNQIQRTILSINYDFLGLG